MVFIALADIGMLAFTYLFIAWRGICERYRKPSEDGHARAARREERWYPLTDRMLDPASEPASS